MKKVGVCVKCWDTDKTTVLTEIIKFSNRKRKRSSNYKTATKLLKAGYDEVCLDCFYKAIGGKEYQKYLERNENLKRIKDYINKED